MARQLHHKSSRGSSNRDRRGLVGGAVYPLSLFRRILLGLRHRRVGEDASGLKYVKLKPDVPSAGEQHVFIDNEGEIKYSEGKNGVSDELEGVSALPKMLTRTLSIHHLECNDYVLKSGESGSHEQSESTGSLVNANNMVHSQVDESSYQLFKEHSSLQEENSEASVSLLEHQKMHDSYENRDVAGNRTKDPIGALALYNAGKEIFFKILQDEDHISENHKQHFQDSDPPLVLTKSDSYPRLGSSRNNTSFSKLRPILDNNNPSVRQEEKSQASNLESCMGGQKGILGPDHRRLDDSVTSGSSRFTSVAHNLKAQRIDSVDKENKKEKYRISMDSVLHKLPYGQKVMQNMRIENSGIADRVTPHFKKSRSLTESMDRYSRLLDSNFSRESNNHVFQRSKSLREDGPFLTVNRSKTLGHIDSLHEFEPCFSRKDALFEPSHAIYSSKASPLNSKRTDSVNDIVVPHEEDIVGVVNTKKASETSDVVDNQHLGHASDNDILETNIGEEQRISSTQSYEDEKFEHSDEMRQVRIACKASHDQKNGPECCYGDEGKNPSPVSDVKSKLQQDPNSMETYLFPEELTPECIGSKELNSSAHLETQDINSRLCPNSSAYDTIRVGIDSKDEAEFNFVRELLKKSGFSGNELSNAWNSTEQPVDFSLFEEVEGSKCRLDFGLYAPDINLDHLLLFDLINEVLLETYSSVLNPWLSRFSSGIRQVAIGSRVLEEVWAKIHWHRSYQLQLNPSLEYILDRDLSKNDGWIDVRYETEYLVQELAALMLDDLLDEAILRQ